MMDSLSQQPSILDSKEEAYNLANQQLQDVLRSLKEVQKSLRRDWEHLAPRERSAQSRILKQLEQQKHLLEDEIKMIGIG